MGRASDGRRRVAAVHGVGELDGVWRLESSETLSVRLASMGAVE
jgi:hypothetical protein